MEDLISKLQGAFPPADVEEYAIASDGGLIYNPLSREADRTSKLHQYDNVPMQEGMLELGGTTLSYKMPKAATAYEMVPVFYTLSSASERTHISVTAFEDESNRRGRDLFDLNLPGNVEVDFEYLGHISGMNIDGLRPKLSATFDDVQGCAYPHYTMTPLTKSGVVSSSDQTWFQFRFTNTGDTILDGDGNGSFQFEPILYKKDENGEYEQHSVPTNLFYRPFKDIYPGDSDTLYVSFTTGTRHLPPGDYKIEMIVSVRCELEEPDYMRVIWRGSPFSVSKMEFTVEENARFTPANPMVKQPKQQFGRNKWMRKHEEFLSSFDSLGNPGQTETGVIYVQPAPWTEQFVIKLILDDKPEISTVAVPIEIESDSIRVELNPDNQFFVIKEDGTRFPAVTTQMMADMRGNNQITPYSGENIINDLLDMTEAGINYLTTTVAFGYDIGDVPLCNCNDVDGFKFGADVLRALGLPMDGLICYPFGHEGMKSAAEKMSGRELDAGDGDFTGLGNPIHSEVAGIFAEYSFNRYGDNYMQYGNGAVPLVNEDSRGWTRVDLNNRFSSGGHTLRGFHKWLLERYHSLENINDAWGSEFASIEDIIPEKDGGPGRHEYPYEYLDNSKIFHDYSAAMSDFDIYRTLERIENYNIIMKDVKEKVPCAAASLRTEGANWIVSGVDPQSKSANMRHVFFAQRRQAMIAELMQESKVLCSHADYTTLPYTPAEVRYLTELAVAQGIPPIHLPQFNRMRDIAVNKNYGLSEYQATYNLESESKGVFISTCTALFPWFKETYEGGGVPGLLWQDYLCDGYTTKVQFDEMKFYRRKLTAAMNTVEGQKWSRNFVQPDDSFKQKSKAKWSYPKEYIRDYVEDVIANKRKSKF